MKIDPLYFLQMWLWFIVVIGFIKYIDFKYKKSYLNLKAKFTLKNYISAIYYFKKLKIEDYLSYEKYDIWRYCEIF